MIQNEIAVLRTISHPNILKMYEIYQEENKLILVLELVEGGDLYTLIRNQKKLSEKSAAVMVKQATEALLEMHRNKMVHRDLKLENIMLTEFRTIKLVDFGFAEKINEKELVSKAGTPGYIPPEIFKIQPYTAKGDVFSLGVILYSLVSGLTCFKGRNFNEVLDDNKRCEISFDRSVWNDVSNECKFLLKKMLEKKPYNRFGCEQILDSDWIALHNNISPKHRKQYSNTMVQKQGSQNSDSEQYEFKMDFSRNTFDLKSFYFRNSFKTQKSSRTGGQSSKSMYNLNNRSSRMRGSLSQTHKQQQIVDAYSQRSHTMKKSRKSRRSKQMESFDESLKVSTLEIEKDFVALSFQNVLFLRVSQQLFNQKKKPYDDPEQNLLLTRSKQQLAHILN